MHRSEDTGPGRREHSGRSRRSRRAGREGGAETQGESASPPPQPAETPLYVFTRAESREVDRRCVEEFGIPSIVLMENAALGVATVVRDLLSRVADPAVLVLAGPGNNGGDGLAVARHLANDGWRVAVILAAAPARYQGDALTNLEIVRRMALPVFAAEPSAARAVEQVRAQIGAPDLVLDALLGTGLDRPPVGIIAELILQANLLRERGVQVVAIDVPSGLDADTGRPFPSAGGGGEAPAVRAHVTVSLLGVKPGYLAAVAQPFIGECLVAGIGAPRALIEEIGRPITDSADPPPSAG